MSLFTQQEVRVPVTIICRFNEFNIYRKLGILIRDFRVSGK